MTQAISVYMSKAISGPNILDDLFLNLEQLNYVTDLNHYISLYGIKLLQLNIWCQSFVLQYSEEPAVFVRLRSETNMTLAIHISFHFITSEKEKNCGVLMQ